MRLKLIFTKGDRLFNDSGRKKTKTRKEKGNQKHKDTKKKKRKKKQALRHASLQCCSLPLVRPQLLVIPDRAIKGIQGSVQFKVMLRVNTSLFYTRSPPFFIIANNYNQNRKLKLVRVFLIYGLKLVFLLLLFSLEVVTTPTS